MNKGNWMQLSVLGLILATIISGVLSVGLWGVHASATFFVLYTACLAVLSRVGWVVAERFYKNDDDSGYYAGYCA